MNESSRGGESTGKWPCHHQRHNADAKYGMLSINVKEISNVTQGGDPPISGGFPSPTALKEEPFTPVSDNNGSNNPSSDLQTQLDTFGADDLNDLDRELVGDGFTLSRLLGGDNPSPTTVKTKFDVKVFPNNASGLLGHPQREHDQHDQRERARLGGELQPGL